MPIVRVLFHALPILPFVLGYRLLGIAAILLVCLPYIKTKKIRGQLQGATDSEVARDLAKTYRRWQALTFIQQDANPSASDGQRGHKKGP